jgi:predicted acylesterase/phospholipase RssA
MAVRDTLSASVAGASGRIRNLIVGETSTFKTTEDVLGAEHETIWGGTLPQADFEAAYRKDVQEKKQAALCLSGGGIRSAAFSLGVLQVLAQRGLLTQFHYLSTVSGGGYIGGWLSRWIADDPQQSAVEIEGVLARREEILQISNLRANSNFLTPKTGITSADTWTGILLWIRNVLLNWTVFIPALVFAVLAPNLYLAVLTWFAAMAQLRTTLFGQNLAVVLLSVASISLVIATVQAMRNMPSHRAGSDLSGREVGWQIVTPLAFWAGLVPLVLVAGGYNVRPEVTFQMFGASMPILIWLIVFTFGAKIAGYLIAAIANHRNLFLYARNSLTWLIVVAIATAALWLAIWIIDALSTWLPDQDRLLMSAENKLDVKVAAVVFALSILGPLGANLAHLLLSTLYVGFRNAGFQDDADREWLARLSAVSVFPALLWAVFATICLFLPFVFFENEWLRNMPWGPTIDRLSKVLGVVSGFVAVLGGKSASAKLDIANASPKSGSAKAFELVVRLATLIFIAFLFTALGYLERTTAEELVFTAKEHDKLGPIAVFVLPRLLVFLTGFVPIYLLWYFLSRKMAVLLVAVLVLVVLSGFAFFANAMGVWLIDQAHSPGEYKILIAQSFIASGLFLLIAIAAMKIDVNRFSMHGVYRNRLVRAFLGGARASRTADPFTDFDPVDNHRVSELKAQKDSRRVLYPVINVTLNLVGGENLAWQERKASSFIITPLYCGSAILGTEITGRAAANDPRRWKGAYVETKDYGGKEPDLNDNKTGISLGTAMTISGAAASPSMGYNSSPGTAFLMTLFNVRLGAWLANPAAEISKEEVKAGPTSALKPLLTEALGLTDAKSDNVYLSDGGHFDNLGIYEMIRRRCRYILVVDADADEKFDFEDLARSVRFAAIDLDAKLEFASIKMKPAREAEETSSTFAIGKITYAESPADPSWLIYLKPTYFYETVPIDVRSYGAANSTFPHETTLDQWFGESQFESYRRLGEYLMCKLYDEHLPKMPMLAVGNTKGHTLEQFFTAIATAQGAEEQCSVALL